MEVEVLGDERSQEDPFRAVTDGPSDVPVQFDDLIGRLPPERAAYEALQAGRDQFCLLDEDFGDYGLRVAPATPDTGYAGLVDLPMIATLV
jgi:hypothetical protein